MIYLKHYIVNEYRSTSVTQENKKIRVYKCNQKSMEIVRKARL